MSIEFDTVTILTTRSECDDEGFIVGANLIQYSIDVPNILDGHKVLDELTTICDSVHGEHTEQLQVNIMRTFNIDSWIAIKMYDSIQETELGKAIITS